MKDVTQTGLGRTWWFTGIMAGLSAMLSLLLLDAAGIASPDNPAQWLVHFFCFYCIWRSLSFLGWLALLLASPSNKLLDPARR